MGEASFVPSVNDADSHSQRLQFLNDVLPHGLDVDAAETPVRGDFNEVSFLEAVWHDFFDIVGKVEQILPVGGVLPLRMEGEVEEGLVKTEAFVEVVELAMLVLRVALAFPSISVVIKVCPLFLVGENLIGLADLDEFVFGSQVLVFVGVPFPGEPLVGLLDVGLTGAQAYPQDMVRVEVRRGLSSQCRQQQRGGPGQAHLPQLHGSGQALGTGGGWAALPCKSK